MSTKSPNLSPFKKTVMCMYTTVERILEAGGLDEWVVSFFPLEISCFGKKVEIFFFFREKNPAEGGRTFRCCLF